MRLVCTAVVAASTATGALAAAAQAAAPVALTGTWQSIVNCVPLAYNVLTGQIHCIGSTEWSGTWTGITSYAMDGNYNLITGAATGTIHEVFNGTGAGGRRGTMTFTEKLTIAANTGAFRVDATLLSGTGGFTGSTGSATFIGTSNAVASSGTYSGTWCPSTCSVPAVVAARSRPKKPAHRRAPKRHRSPSPTGKHRPKHSSKPHG